MRADSGSKQMVSAGGVVYRVNHGGVEVVVCGRESSGIWALPKGTPNPGETRRETALREVREETGLEVEIEDFIDGIDYWFVRSTDGTRCHKTVFFFLMSAIGGTVSMHDHEFDVVQWLPQERVLNMLTYVDEVRIVRKGLSMVSKKARVE